MGSIVIDFSSMFVLLGAIEIVVVTRHESKLLTGDHLMGHSVEVDLDEGHHSTSSDSNPGNQEG